MQPLVDPPPDADSDSVDDDSTRTQTETVGDAEIASLRSTPSTIWIGSGFGLVGPRAVALIDGDNFHLAEAIWPLLQDDAPIDEVLERITAVGLKELRDLAIAIREPDCVRIVLRGNAVAEVDTADGPTPLTAANTRTWREVAVVGATAFTIRISDSDSDQIEPSPYRISTGVVPAVAVAWPAHEVLMSAEAARVDSARLPELQLTGTVGPARHPGRDVERSFAGDNVEIEPTDAVANEYDALYGLTVARSVQQAAVRADQGAHAEPSVSVPDEARDESETRVFQTNAKPAGALIEVTPFAASGASQEDIAGQSDKSSALGDHDGMTISRTSLGAPATQSGSSSAPAGPVVHALLCPIGHPNPTHLSVCRQCYQSLGVSPITMPRPALGRLVLSTGAVVELARPALLGRSPKYESRVGQETPQLVTVGTGQEISRTHLAIRIEGWQVLAEDLGSSNGTTVTLPGRPPQRLRPAEPVMLEPGSIVDLGGEVSGRYESP